MVDFSRVHDDFKKKIRRSPSFDSLVRMCRHKASPFDTSQFLKHDIINKSYFSIHSSSSQFSSVGLGGWSRWLFWRRAPLRYMFFIALVVIVYMSFCLRVDLAFSKLERIEQTSFVRLYRILGTSPFINARTPRLIILFTKRQRSTSPPPSRPDSYQS